MRLFRVKELLYGNYNIFDWLYNFFVSIVTFIMSLFGFDMKNRSVTFEDDVKPAEESSETVLEATIANDSPSTNNEVESQQPSQ